MPKLTRPGYFELRDSLVAVLGGVCETCRFADYDVLNVFHAADPIQPVKIAFLDVAETVLAAPTDFRALCANCAYKSRRRAADKAYAERLGARAVKVRRPNLYGLYKEAVERILSDGPLSLSDVVQGLVTDLDISDRRAYAVISELEAAGFIIKSRVAGGHKQLALTSFGTGLED